jgi:hypothetical protein
MWWDRDPDGFHSAFLAFTERLEGNFKFEMCDVLADFTRRAVAVTRDSVILQEAIRGLTRLGYNHNRWPVRDIAVAIFQKIRSDEAAGAAIEGLRMAGMDAAEWTVGETSASHAPPGAARWSHQFLRKSANQFLEPEHLNQPTGRTYPRIRARQSAGPHHGERHADQGDGHHPRRAIQRAQLPCTARAR